MKKIELRFNDRFSHWGICLPPDDLEQRRRGKIIRAGWAIWYLFGSDEKGEYLDYYAAHRITDDTHIRIYDNGLTAPLPAIRGMRICSKDPEEDARQRAEFDAENQRVARMLEEKGFGLSGDEPGGVQMNRFLHLRGTDKS